MEYVNLGRTGLRVSRLCLGTMTFGSTAWRPWILPEDAGRPFIRRALDAGINFFDTADMYSRGVSEEIVGRALNEFTTREQVVIATKAFFPMGDGPNDRGLSRKHLFDAIDASLRRLGTDYVDLYQIHRFDPHTPIVETGALTTSPRGHGALHRASAVRLAVRRMSRCRAPAGRASCHANHYNLVTARRSARSPAWPREGSDHSRSRGARIPGGQPRPFRGSERRRRRDGARADRRVRHRSTRRCRLLRGRPGVDSHERAEGRGQVRLAWILRQPGGRAECRVRRSSNSTRPSRPSRRARYWSAGGREPTFASVLGTVGRSTSCNGRARLRCRVTGPWLPSSS